MQKIFWIKMLPSTVTSKFIQFNGGIIMSSAASNIHIRTASPDDAAALLAIYAPYVLETAITFEYDVPSTEEFARRITHTLEKYPYLVAEKDHTILGYAYAGPFHERAAYDWAVETSIYVDQNLKHSGIGGLLHDVLKMH